MLLAPAIELGKEYLYLKVYRWDQHGMADRVRELTPAESQEADMTRLKEMADFGTLIFFVCWPYYVLTESSALQATLGKRILGLQVTDLDGRRIRLGRSVLRYLARMVSALPWQLGFVMAAFTAKKQALHDMLVGTLVVIANKAEETEGPSSASTSTDRDSAVQTLGGSLIDKMCSSCMTELPREAKYCYSCGTPVPRPAAAIEYSVVGRRALAMLVDTVILLPAVAVFINLFPPLSSQDVPAIRALASNQLSNIDRENVQLTTMTVSAYLWVVIFSLGLPYFVLTECSVLQGTLGKRLLGLRVTDLDGRRIGLGRACGRYVAHILSAALWFAGFIMAALTPKRQALHDILAETLVVDVKRAR